MFLFVLPSWVEFRWGRSKPWVALGLSNADSKNFYRSLLQGCAWSMGLVIGLLLTIFAGSWGGLQENISLDNLLNAVILGCSVGFAEELIFRGWLWSELNLLLGRTWGFIVQAILFSLSHIIAFIKLKLGFLAIMSLLIGLLLLGLVLALRRILDNGSLGGCLGLHGGLVGIWFFVNEDIIDVVDTIPTWVSGPGVISPNPIGGGIGILSLALILFVYRNAFAIAGRPCNGARKASSKGAIP